MAQFLNTEAVTQSLSRIIEKADKKVLLISPYISINTRLAQLIESKLDSGTEVHIIYRRSEQSEEVEEWLGSMPYIRTSFCENLHAKCYLNETEALITSMNLYEYSQVGNLEMGIGVSRRRELRLYREIEAHARYIEGISKSLRVPEPNSTVNDTSVLGSLVSGIRSFGRKQEPESDQPAEPIGVPEPPTARTQPAQPSPQPQTLYPNDGQPASAPFWAVPASLPTESYAAPIQSQRNQIHAPTSGLCIRCGADIPADPLKPYCRTHFRSWNRYKNDDYEEEICHICGGAYSATMAKPVCRACYQKYKSVLQFATA